MSQWLTYWINFKRKIQRVYTVEGSPQFESAQRSIDVWKNLKAFWVKSFSRRSLNHYTKLNYVRATATT